MRPLLEELKIVMLQEKAIYDELLQLAGEKKEVLIHNKVDRLNEMLRLEAERMQALEKINPSIVALLSEIAEKEGATISDALAAIEDSSERDMLQALQQEFQRTAQELRTKNELNQLLIQTQLQYTSFCLELFTQDTTAGDIYSAGGYVNDTPTERRGLIDREA